MSNLILRKIGYGNGYLFLFVQIAHLSPLVDFDLGTDMAVRTSDFHIVVQILTVWWTLPHAHSLLTMTMTHIRLLPLTASV